MRILVNITPLLLTKAFEFDALSQFVLFRQLGLPMACGSAEEYNIDKRTI